MAKHLNPLEKEFLVRKYRNNPGVRLSVGDGQDSQMTVTVRKKSNVPLSIDWESGTCYI